MMPYDTALPTLPCRSLADPLAFYQTLGLTVAWQQSTPTPYAMGRRGSITLHYMLCIALLSLLVGTPQAADQRHPEQSMPHGVQALQQGAFADAVPPLLAAAQAYQQQGQLQGQQAALLRLAQAYQALGHYQQALHSLQTAQALAEQLHDRTGLVQINAQFGQVYGLMGSLERAQQYSTEALLLARAQGLTDFTAALLYDLGNLLAAQEQYQEALSRYNESLSVGPSVIPPALRMRIHTQAATAAMRLGLLQEAQQHLGMAHDPAEQLPVSHEQSYSLVHLGLAYHALSALLSDTSPLLVLQAAQRLQQAANMARELGDQRALAYALGSLGTLYEEAQRYDEALHLTRQALFAAQQLGAPEVLYRWQWQSGRLFKALGNRDAALTAYRQAVQTLQSFRQELLRGAGLTRVSFRDAVGPVYFGLVDLLLQRAAALPEPAQAEPYLVAARDVVEGFKAGELQDYFQDDCVEATRAQVASLESVSPTAVVIYPILLPDRTELLVNVPTGFQRYTVPVNLATMTREIRAFRQKLEKRTTHEYLPHAQQLYDWLIRPLEPALRSTPLTTLVFVPDGPLRTIPIAALHDGQTFLIARYALATTPGLTLTDPRPLQRTSTKLLALGLTQATQGFPALPYVSREIAAVQRLYNGNVLMDQDFQTVSVQQELRHSRVNIIHIASHGQFAHDADKTFLLTFDDKLSMEDLQQVVGRFRLRDQPLELLTLSACQTAAGDDRAALGLAGIAIKAGARSALATLWFINDQASAELVTEFYRQLQLPTVSRAVALQQAQLRLLRNQRYQHPGYWSPFLLLNNWL